MVTNKIDTLSERISRFMGIEIAYGMDLHTKGLVGKNKFFTVNLVSVWAKRDYHDSPWRIVVRIVGHPSYGDENGEKIAHEIESCAEEVFCKFEKRAMEFTADDKRIRVRLGDKQITQIQNAIDKTVSIAKNWNEKNKLNKTKST